MVSPPAHAGLDVTALGGSREALLVLGFLTSDTVTDVASIGHGVRCAEAGRCADYPLQHAFRDL